MDLTDSKDMYMILLNGVGLHSSKRCCCNSKMTPFVFYCPENAYFSVEDSGCVCLQ